MGTGPSSYSAVLHSVNHSTTINVNLFLECIGSSVLVKPLRKHAIRKSALYPAETIWFGCFVNDYQHLDPGLALRLQKLPIITRV